jgi:hypothetical protein
MLHLPCNMATFSAVDVRAALSSLSLQYFLPFPRFRARFCPESRTPHFLFSHEDLYFISTLLLINPNFLSNGEKEECRRDPSAS